MATAAQQPKPRKRFTASRQRVQASLERQSGVDFLIDWCARVERNARRRAAETARMQYLALGILPETAATSAAASYGA